MRIVTEINIPNKTSCRPKFLYYFDFDPSKIIPDLDDADYPNYVGFAKEYMPRDINKQPNLKKPYTNEGLALQLTILTLFPTVHEFITLSAQQFDNYADYFNQIQKLIEDKYRDNPKTKQIYDAYKKFISRNTLDLEVFQKPVFMDLL